MLLKDFVIELLRSAEKAANLARVVRAEGALFELLVQEKKGDQSNKRFVQDFKTLADVLVQETVRHDLSLKVCLETNILLLKWLDMNME
jgi:inositol polyphosphate 1-phosphatase